MIAAVPQRLRPLPDELATPMRYRLATCASGEPAGIATDRAEVLRYLGYRGQAIDEALEMRIEHIADELERALEPRGTSRIFSVAIATDASGQPCIRLAGSAIELHGRDAYRRLKDACAAAVFAVTLGMESERRLRALAARGPVAAAVGDAACTALVEAAADRIDATVRHAASAYSLSSGTRFSCGYGDCPLSDQRALIDALDARRTLGITLAPSNLMIPTKSVTAIMGLFEGAPAHDAPAASCAGCTVRDGCAFRAHGDVCWRAPSSPFAKESV